MKGVFIKIKKKMNKVYTKKCARCNSLFKYNPIIQGDDVCNTCSRLNDITFWYPRLFRLGFPTPKTIIIHTNVDLETFSNNPNFRPEGFTEFLAEIESAIKKIGLPAFLRTGYTSNKHDWKRSCFISDLKNIKGHIFNLAEFSAMATIDRFMPCDFWAVREFIKTKKYFSYFSGEMPITKERRFFVRNGKVECQHSYWSKEAFKEDIDKKKFEELSTLSKEDEKIIFQMAKYISNVFTGYWSCDFLKAESGDWYLTDMAIGERSYHDKSCKNA